jgi:hypothetical protein
MSLRSKILLILLVVVALYVLVIAHMEPFRDRLNGATL